MERMLRLAQKTGGKLIITDAAGNKPVVILDLDEYEALLDGGSTPSAGRRPLRTEAPSVVPTPDTRRNEIQPIEDEDEADVTMMEEALLAVEESMPETPEEPKMVPVKVEESEAEEVAVPVQNKGRAPAPQPVPVANEVGEEQFYLEPL